MLWIIKDRHFLLSLDSNVTMSRQSRRARRKKEAEEPENKIPSGEQKNRLFFKLLIIVPVLFFAIIILCYVGVRFYISGQSFHRTVKTSIELGLSGKAEVAKLRWSGWRCESQLVNFTEGEGGVKEIEFEGMSTDLKINSAFSDQWQITQCSLNSLFLKLGSPSEGYVPYEFKKSRGLASMLPSKYWFENIEIDRFTLEYVAAAGSYLLEDAKVTGKQTANGVYDFSLIGGDISTPLELLPVFELHKAGLLVSSNGIEFYDVEAELPGGYNLDLDFSYDKTLGKVFTKFNSERLNVKELSAFNLDRYFSGNAGIGGTYRWNALEDESTYQVAIDLKDTKLKSLDFIEGLSQIVLLDRFTNIGLDDARLNIGSSNGVDTSIDAFFKTNDVLTVETALIWSADDRIKGSIRLGIYKDYLSSAGKLASSLFKEGSGGMYWASIDLDTSLARWKESLAVELVKGAISKTVERSVDLLKNGKNFLEDKDSLFKGVGEILEDAEIPDIPLPKVDSVIPNLLK